MPCFYPIYGYRSRTVGESGKRGFVFNPKEGFTDLPMEIPCGQCVGCRLERSRQWAVRMMHEAKMHSENCFLTLTYDDEHLPKFGSLLLPDWQNFMKKLRREIEPRKVRFFHCGEYGETTNRPHYHACLFGYDFTDKYEWMHRGENLCWRSESLDKWWGKGSTELGEMNFDTAAYCARYIMKKVTGRDADWAYDVVDQGTGEIGRALPEYTTMSRRPGIGNSWFEKYGGEVYRRDEVIVKGRAAKPPKYYDTLHEIVNPDAHERVLRARMDGRSRKDETPERLQVREVCTKARLNQSQRGI